MPLSSEAKELTSKSKFIKKKIYPFTQEQDDAISPPYH